MKSILILSLIAFFMSTVSSEAQTGTDYYPLNIGNYWIMESSSGGKNADPPLRTKTEVECIEKKNGLEVFRIKSCSIIKNEPSISYQWLRTDDIGNVIYCSLGAHSPEMVLIDWDPPMIILPGDVSEGSYWDYTMEYQSDDYPDSTLYETTRYVVKSTTETISVPAGTFNDCIKVRGISTFCDSENIRIFYHYYAKGVGQVLFHSMESKKEAYRIMLVEYHIN